MCEFIASAACFGFVLLFWFMRSVYLMVSLRSSFMQSVTVPLGNAQDGQWILKPG